MQARSTVRRALHGALLATQVGLIAVLVVTASAYGLAYVAVWLDDAAYHIPGAVRIAQHWSPYFVDSPFDPHWYPAGVETVVAVFVLATGSIRATNVSGPLSFLVICVLVYRFAGLWTREIWARLSCVLCCATIPLLLGQCLAFYVDIHMALVVLGALYLNTLAFARRRAAYAYAGLAVAVLGASIKYAGLYFLAVLGPAALFFAWLSEAPRRPQPLAAVLLAAALLFTSGFYVRNWLERGNPLYPIDLPGMLRTVARLSPAPYESDPDVLALIEIPGQMTALPHPWLPASWPRTELRPDMSHDGFGVGGTLAFAGAVLSSLFLRHLDRRRRLLWLSVWGQTASMVLLFPLHASIPRYVLFLPIVASLSPAVLAATRRSRAARATAMALGALILAASAVYVHANLIGDGVEWTRLHQAAKLVARHPPGASRAVGYAQRGHLRIGYTSGYGNLIALLYDPAVTNQLVPLHYRNYDFNHAREFATADEFLAHVRSLDLDYIQIFDPSYPGAAMLQRHFPDRTWVWDHRAATARPAAAR